MQIQEPLTGLQLLTEFRATKALKKLGLTDADLASIRFSSKYRNEPIDDWLLIARGGLFANLTGTELAHAMRLAREYAVARHAFVDPDATQRARAFELCALTEIAPVIEQGRLHVVNQKKRAQKERGYVPELKDTMKRFGSAFHRKRSIQSLPMKERWYKFIDALKFAGLAVEDRGAILKYDYKEGKKKLSYRAFAAYDGLAL